LTLGHSIDTIGYTVNTAALTASITENRRLRILDKLDAIQRTQRIAIRQLKALAGSTISTFGAMGIMAYARSRHLLHAANSSCNADDPAAPLSAGAQAELRFWRTWASSTHVYPCQETIRPISHVIHSDASDTGAGAVATFFDGRHTTTRAWAKSFTGPERRLSSTAREILGYQYAMEQLYAYQPAALSHVLIVGDNQAAEAIFQRGGSCAADPSDGALHSADAVTAMLHHAALHTYTLSFRWVRRCHNTMADLASRLGPVGDLPDAFRLSRIGFEDVRMRASDAFGARPTTVSFPFQRGFPRGAMSLDPSHASFPADAFSPPWNQLHGLPVLMPPRWAISLVLEHIRLWRPATGILIVPAHTWTPSYQRILALRGDCGPFGQPIELPREAVYTQPGGPRRFHLFTIHHTDGP